MALDGMGGDTMSENSTAAGDMQLCWEKKHGNYILYDTHGRGGGSGPIG